MKLLKSLQRTNFSEFSKSTLVRTFAIASFVHAKFSNLLDSRIVQDIYLLDGQYQLCMLVLTLGWLEKCCSMLCMCCFVGNFRSILVPIEFMKQLKSFIYLLLWNLVFSLEQKKKGKKMVESVIFYQVSHMLEKIKI